MGRGGYEETRAYGMYLGASNVLFLDLGRGYICVCVRGSTLIETAHPGQVP